ncbi:hypothetical protein PaeBR_02055 [Paenibacillus sp. BR2-3]|uniref:hypothetical protein n=1 Tax=Paenibacillus sp. BR2-3 TaxID=3048494 RepID=UPI003977A4D3
MLVMSVSFVIMAAVEIAVFMNHISSIRIALKEYKPELTDLEQAYIYTHELPKKAVYRILGPHLLGHFGTGERKPNRIIPVKQDRSSKL